MKKILGIIALSLLFSGNVYAEKYPSGRVLYKDSEKIHIVRTGFASSLSKVDQIAINHCGNNKYTYRVGAGTYIGKGKLLKFYQKKGHKFPAFTYPTIAEYICSEKDYSLNPPNSYRPNKKLAQKWSPQKNTNYTSNSNNSSNNNSNISIEFNIKQKKEQCTAIGFKPETEKFADCVLRLVELDVKTQQQNQIAVAQNGGNDALVKQLKRQSNLQSSKALIDLGQQLMNPKRYNSNIYMPKTQRCVMQGFGSFAKMTCR